jgi:hypothetical protein
LNAVEAEGFEQLQKHLQSLAGRSRPDQIKTGLAYASALAAMFFCIELFGVIDASILFIYFQF